MRYPNHLFPAISRSLTLTTSPSTTTTLTSKNPATNPPSSSESVEWLAKLGFLKDAVRSLVLLHHRGEPVKPNAFFSILKLCADRKALMEGRQVHAHIVITGFNHDTFVFNHLISTYGRCGSLSDAHSVFRVMGRRNLHSWNNLISCYCKLGSLSNARQLFEEMPKRDSVSWNMMIAGYDQHGPCEEALEIFVRMRRSDARVDHFGVSSVISACSNLRFLSDGKQLHAYSSKIGLDSDVHVGSSLVGLYAKCMEIGDARLVFEGMVIREQFTWNTMLSGYVQCSKVDEALVFFSNMPDKNVVSWTTIVAGCSQHDRNDEAKWYFLNMLVLGLKPDQVSFVSVLDACVGSLDLEGGSKIHGLILKSGFETNVFVGSVLVALYAECGCFMDARGVIDAMPFVDDFSWSILIAEYAKHGEIERSNELFESLEVKSLSLWNALLTGYSELGLYEQALEAFQEMHEGGLDGDEFTFGSLLMGSDTLGLSYGKQLHLQAIKIGVSCSVFVSSALIDMYCYFSDCKAAKQVFDAVSKPNLILWNVMIFGYSQNNLGWEAIHTFQLMRILGVKPDNISFSCVLDLCSSLCALGLGMQVHALAHGLSFESDVVVGSAIVDMYAKCGNMEHGSLAFSHIRQHNVVSWTALVTGYMMCGMWETAMELFNIMPERNVVSWNMMISGHARHGSELVALKLYSQMNKSGVLPDRISFVSLLTVCCNLLLEEQTKQVHAQIIKTDYHMNAHVSTALTSAYQKLRKLPDMHQKPGNFVDTAEADAVSWRF